MPRDPSAHWFRWGALALWSGLCLGAVTANPGCSPGAPTGADAQATPARLKAAQEKGRASMAIKTTKRPSRSAPPESNPR
jgi:hypothetical protein